MASFIKRKNIFVIFCVLTILWMAVIFSFSSADAAQSSLVSESITEKIVELFNPGMRLIGSEQFQALIDSVEAVVRKVAHGFNFAVLGALCYIATVNSEKIKQFQGAILSFVICCVYAVSDEIHQLFVPGRSGQVSDVIIDTLGSVVGIAIVFFIYKILAKKQRQ